MFSREKALAPELLNKSRAELGADFRLTRNRRQSLPAGPRVNENQNAYGHGL